MPAITLSKSNNREIKINERANLNLPLCTGERFKKKGHAGILKGLSLQEPSVVSRAEVLQHSRAVARMWGPLCPPSSPQPREPLWGMQVQQRVQVCRCAHLGLNTCGGVSNPSRPLHSPGWGCIPAWNGHSCQARGSCSGCSLLCGAAGEKQQGTGLTLGSEQLWAAGAAGGLFQPPQGHDP